MTHQFDPTFFSHLSRFQRLYAKGLTNRLSPYGVHPGYLALLQQLWSKDSVTQTMLQQTMDIEQATISNTLKRMERDGLIIRTPSESDRRIHLITLTPQGRSLQTTVNSAMEDLATTVNKGLTFNDLRYFNRIMRQMTEQLEEDQAESVVVLLDEITD